MTAALEALRRERMYAFAAYLEEEFGCRQCKGSGYVTAVDGDGDCWAVPCPEGCRPGPRAS